MKVAINGFGRIGRSVFRILDQRADVYAFGLILYDMLLGRRRHAHAASAIEQMAQEAGPSAGLFFFRGRP